MMGSKKNNIYFKLLVILCLTGVTSLSIFSEGTNYLIIPTIVLLITLYITDFLIYKILKEENILFPIVTFMVVIGWLVLLRIQPTLAGKQLLWIILGCAVLVLLLKFLFIFSNDFILKYKIYWLLLTFLLLIMPVLLGVEVGGARSWMEIFGLRFQPSEAAKISFLVFLAAWLKENHGVSQKKWLAWLGTFISIGFLVLQKDLGTALVFYLAFLTLLYLATGKIKNSIIGLLLLVIGAILAYGYFPHVRVRMETWLNPWTEPDGGGYQILQSLFAFANGGVWGTGFGGGMPQVIPEAHTDFVFAVIGEQLGILGTIGVVILYLFFTFFSLKKSQLIPTLGSRLLAAGLSLVVVIQAFIIMGGVTKLIPLTGLPLPFISYGGSSTLNSFIMLGIIMWLHKEKGFVPAVSRKRLININRLIWGMFFAVIVILSYWHIGQGKSLLQHPYNPRLHMVENNTIRGSIYANDYSLLAGESQGERIYPLGNAGAHLVGYNSNKYGKSGLEGNLNNYLLAIPDLYSGFILEERRGWDVYTTINPKLQVLAWNLHKDYSGASVVFDVKKGDILAIVSTPAFDPNNIEKQWVELKDDQNNRFFNRATQGLYPPGSVFKIITGTILLKLNPELKEKPLDIPTEIKADGYSIEDLIKKKSLTFKEALGFSSNIYFIKELLKYDWNLINRELADSFKINKDFSSQSLPIAKASLGTILDRADFASTVIGQGEVLITPIHMAIWAGAIANGGLMLQPRLIDKIVNPLTGQEEKFAPVVIGNICKKEIAEEVLQGLAFSVNYGTGQKAKVEGISIGGKTGSAENSHLKTHAWFVGVAPLEDPQVVVVTLVENGGRGGETAAPIAKKLLKAAFE